jgi:hypothetical protein
MLYFILQFNLIHWYSLTFETYQVNVILSYMLVILSKGWGREDDGLDV